MARTLQVKTFGLSYDVLVAIWKDLTFELNDLFSFSLADRNMFILSLIEDRNCSIQLSFLLFTSTTSTMCSCANKSQAVQRWHEFKLKGGHGMFRFVDCRCCYKLIIVSSNISNQVVRLKCSSPVPHNKQVLCRHRHSGVGSFFPCHLNFLPSRHFISKALSYFINPFSKLTFFLLRLLCSDIIICFNKMAD